jgi:hypothetical protein
MHVGEISPIYLGYIVVRIGACILSYALAYSLLSTSTNVL